MVYNRGMQVSPSREVTAAGSQGHPGWDFAFVAAFVALDAFSTIGLYREIGVSPWNPAAGLTLAYVCARGLRSWPFVIAAATLSAFTVAPISLPYAQRFVVIVAGSSLWLMAGQMLRTRTEFDPQLQSVNAALFMFAIASVTSAIDTIQYIGALWSAGLVNDQQVFPAAWRHLVGNLVGILAVAPLAMHLRAGKLMTWPSLTHVIQFSLLCCTLFVIFSYREATTYQLFYLLFIPILWVALREGIGGSILMINITQIGLILGAQMLLTASPSIGALQILMIVLAATGLLTGVVVTERQIAEERLRDQQAALGRALRLRSAGETAAAIAHQINQPITALSTYASIAKDALKSGNTAFAGTALDKLSNECDRAASVLRSIRDLVKQGTLERKPIRLQQIAADLAAQHHKACSVAGIALKLDFPERAPPVYCDQIQVGQALDNLVNNAIEAILETRRPGQIVVEARLVDDEIRIEVRDDGPGFAPGLSALVTNPFITTKPDGSGLGLAIARSVVEAHGGSLAIVPISLGACIRLRLPATR